MMFLVLVHRILFLNILNQSKYFFFFPSRVIKKERENLGYRLFGLGSSEGFDVVRTKKHGTMAKSDEASNALWKS